MPISSRSAYVVTPEFRVNTTVTGQQLMPGVGTLADGGHVVVWSDASKVMGQRYDAAGNPAGGEFTVASSKIYNNLESPPAVIALAGGGFAVAWNEDTSYHVKVQRFDASGNAVGSLIDVYGSGATYNPSITATADGGFVVTASIGTTSGVANANSVLLRRFTADGTPLGTAITLVTGNVGTAYGTVAALSSGNLVTLWRAGDGSGGGLFGRILGPSGINIGPDFQVNTTTAGDQKVPVITALADGGFVVAWQSAGQDGAGWGIYARRFDAAGIAVGSEFRVNTTAAGDQTLPAVTALADGGFSIAWTSNGQDGFGLGVYAQRYSAAGTAVGGETRVAQTNFSDQGQPSITGRPDGGWVVAWMGNSTVGLGSGNDIYSRIYAPTTMAPVIVAPDRRIAVSAAPIQVSELFDVQSQTATASRPGGVPAVQTYEFTDQSVGGGYFTVNGEEQTAGTPFTIAAANLPTVRWVSSSTGGADTVAVRAFDGEQWGEIDTAQLTAVMPPSAYVATPEFRVNTTVTGQQLMPGVGTLADGGHVVVWSDASKVMGQRYDAAGNPAGGEFTVASSKIYNNLESPPAVIALAGGGFAVAWNEDTSYHVKVQRFDASGNAVGSLIDVYGSGATYNPSITATADGGFVVTASIGTTSGVANANSVLLRRFTADGTPLGTAITLVTGNVGTAYGTVAALSSGNLVTLWRAGDGSGGGLFGRILGPSGINIGPDFQVNTTTAGDQKVPVITALADGGFVVAWQSAGQDGAGWGIYARRFDAAGIAVGSEFRVNTTAAGDQTLPAVTALADGGFSIAWTSNGQDGFGLGVYAQRYSAAGTAVGGETRVAQTTYNAQDQPSITGRPDGSWVVTWRSDNNTGTGTDIYSRIYGTPGSLPDGFTEVIGSAGDDWLIGTPAREILSGNLGNDYLDGADGTDLLDGGAGNDTLVSSAGDDTLKGGLGNDTYIVSDTGNVVSEGISEGTDSVLTDLAEFTLPTNVEVLTYTGTGNFTGTGNVAANTIQGGIGDDTLDGAAGTDKLFGGMGNDVYIVDVSGDVVTENADEGTDEVRTILASYTLGANLEKLTYIGSSRFSGTGNALDNTLTGGAGNDTLSGAAGNDTLDGGAGVDSLNGGAGNDVYIVDNAGDIVMEALNSGIDEVRTSLSTYTLGANVEILTYNGTGNVTVTGNALANRLQGGAGNDTLDGGVGADTLEGGTGNDVYILENVGDVITEAANAGTDEVRTTLTSYTLGANVENLTYTGTGAFVGVGNSAGNLLTGGGGADTLSGDVGDDTLLGNAGADNLDGGSGDDSLDGGLGADTLAGGAGNDSYVVDNAGDVVVEAAGAGTDTVRTTLATYALGANVETLAFIGSGVFNGTGNALDNTLTGGAGADSLDGGGGNDTLDGGAGGDLLTGGVGDDLYIVDNAGDLVVEAAGEGIDTVRTNLAAYTLTAEVETLILIGGAALGVGNALDNTLTGAGGADTLVGGLGADTLNGGGGADSLVGGAGDDLYVVDNAGDMVVEAVGEGTDEVRTTRTTYALTAEVEVLTFTGSGAFAGTGNASDNRIQGGGGADTLNGGLGADTLVGGAGNDVYVVDAIGDVVVEVAGQGRDTVRTDLAVYALAVEIENLVYTGAGAFAGAGNALANRIDGGTMGDTLSGGDGADTISGGGGADLMAGGAGNDVFFVDDAGDVVSELSGDGTDEVRTTLAAYTLDGEVEVLTYTGSGAFTGTGNESANRLQGGAGNDTLDGRSGADTLVGGLGDDVYVVDDAGDVVIEAADGGFDAVVASVSVTLGANIEILTLGGTADLDGTGNALGNRITGNVGANRLDGGGGADTLIGGGGDDVYVIDDAGDVVIEVAGEGRDEIHTTLSAYTLGAEVEDLTYLGNGSFSGIGNALANRLQGGAGADSLDGGGGADTLVGGQGDDVYIAEETDTIIEAAGEGTDTVRTGLSGYTLGINLETLIYTGTGVFAGTGNGLDNRIEGGAGADTLDGSIGSDILVGGSGDDLYWIDASGDVVVEAVGEGADTVMAAVSWTLSDNVEALVLTGGNDLDGTGNAGDNALIGNAGANRLDGGGGADTLIGGADDDVYVVDDAGDVVIEVAGEGRDEIHTTLSAYTLGAEVEDLTYLGNGSFSGIGNALANRLQGGAGADSLDGGGGADTLVGGQGDDVYIAEETDTIIEAAGEGMDTVRTGLSGYTLGANLETLIYTGTGVFAGMGNGLDNRIEGGAGADTLDGGTGSDILVGGSGDDLYWIDASGDVVVEVVGEGADTVMAAASWTLSDNVEALVLTGSNDLDGTGNAGDNVLIGNAGANRLDGGGGADALEGGAGNDTLVGGAGADTLSGGSGADVFRFLVEGDSAPEGEDLVYDFSQADGDRLDLSLIDADTALAGDNTFTFIGEDAFTGTAGQLRFMAAGSDTWLVGDTNGDGTADLKIVLRGSVTLTATDIVL